MSRLAKKPLEIPSGLDVKINGSEVIVKGPKGELKKNFNDLDVKITKDKELKIEKTKKGDSARWGLAHALLKNMIIGAQKGFEKKLEVNGVGYRANVTGKKLILALGFSHPVEKALPVGIEAKVQKNVITLSGPDAQILGDFAAEIRRIRPPEPYKGKGIKYIDEHIRRKEGKKAVAEGAPGGGS